MFQIQSVELIESNVELLVNLIRWIKFGSWKVRRLTCALVLLSDLQRKRQRYTVKHRFSRSCWLSPIVNVGKSQCNRVPPGTNNSSSLSKKFQESVCLKENKPGQLGYLVYIYLFIKILCWRSCQGRSDINWSQCHITVISTHHAAKTVSPRSNTVTTELWSAYCEHLAQIIMCTYILFIDFLWSPLPFPQESLRNN